ncbi:hypothetical protein PPERSA_08830 [Pseudocohnilembus persalinus]|uniref:Uncharacterized protein n=1 Tax=Pseudocohnilembus persalinus TaxID=266149 RepID=A0A0V0R402_PSEPJ|nr:hypothetical protein PPERSA_08830 [Pseudocohnilembus persalinus]|eukprot:KRX09114.1 hypothetical protein PPERSA_08830 [Pseudocohnilembus persalinus]
MSTRNYSKPVPLNQQNDQNFNQQQHINRFGNQSSGTRKNNSLRKEPIFSPQKNVQQHSQIVSPERILGSKISNVNGQNYQGGFYTSHQDGSEIIKAQNNRIQHLEERIEVITTEFKRQKQDLDFKNKEVNSWQQGYETLQNQLNLHMERVRELDKNIEDMKNDQEKMIIACETREREIKNLQKIIKDKNNQIQELQQKKQISEKQEETILKQEDELKILKLDNQKLLNQIEYLENQFKINRQNQFQQSLQKQQQLPNYFQSPQQQRATSPQSNNYYYQNLQNQQNPTIHQSYIVPQQQQLQQQLQQQIYQQQPTSTYYTKVVAPSQIQNFNQNQPFVISNRPEIQYQGTTIRTDKKYLSPQIIVSPPSQQLPQQQTSSVQFQKQNLKQNQNQNNQSQQLVQNDQQKEVKNVSASVQFQTKAQ